MPKPLKPPRKLLHPLVRPALRTPKYFQTQVPITFYDYVRQLIALNKKEPHLLSAANIEQEWKDEASKFYRGLSHQLARMTTPASMGHG